MEVDRELFVLVLQSEFTEGFSRCMGWIIRRSTLSHIYTNSINIVLLVVLVQFELEMSTG